MGGGESADAIVHELHQIFAVTRFNEKQGIVGLSNLDADDGDLHTN